MTEHLAGGEQATIIAQQWCAVLGVAHAPGTDFFAAGGHSLLAIELTTRLEDALRTVIDPTQPYQTARFEDFVRAVIAAAAISRIDDTRGVGAVPLFGRMSVEPASWQQEGLITLARRVGGTGYERRRVLVLRDRQDADRLGAVLSAWALDPPTVLTAVVPPTGPLGTLRPAGGTIRWHISDAADSCALVAKDQQAPFDLSTQTLRVTIAPAALPPVALFTSHQVFLDEPSMDLLLALVAARLAAAATTPPAAATPSYRQYVRWQHERARARAAALAYWRQRLAAVSFAGGTVISPDGADTWGEGAHLSASLGIERHQVEQAASAWAMPPFSVLLGVFTRLLGRRTNGESFVIASSTLNRPAGFRHTLGCFASAELTVHQTRRDATLAQAAARVVAEQRHSRPHAIVPMDLLLEELDQPGLAQLKFSYERGDERPYPLPEGFTTRPVPDEMTRRDLTITVVGTETLTAQVRYRPDRIPAQVVTDLLQELHDDLKADLPAGT